MKTSKKTEANTLRERADEAIRIWRDAEAAYETELAAVAAFEEETKLRFKDTNWKFDDIKTRLARRDAEIERVEREIPLAEAEARVHVAGHEAMRALDAAERSEGDELAIASDLASLRAALLSDDEEVARLKAAIVEVTQRRAARPNAARASREKLAERRAADGLPLPQCIPSVPFDASPDAIVAALHERIVAGPPAVGTRQILSLKNKVDELRAAREVARREVEKAEAEAAHRAKERAEMQRLAAEEDRAAWQAKLAEERAERDALVAADRERAAG